MDLASLFAVPGAALPPQSCFGRAQDGPARFPVTARRLPPAKPLSRQGSACCLILR